MKKLMVSAAAASVTLAADAPPAVRPGVEVLRDRGFQGPGYDGEAYRTHDVVCGTDYVRKTFGQNFKVSDIMDYWNKNVEAFRSLSRKYYLL